MDASPLTQLQAAGADVAAGFRAHPAWRYLAFESVKNQYRRTVLGPWWLTLQTATYVLGLALVFGQLQQAGLKDFLPYVAVGFLSFILLIGLTRAGASVFTAQAATIKSTRQPLSSLVLRNVAVETIQFGHNAVIVVLFFAIGLITLSPWLALAPVALAAIVVNGIATSLWLGPLTARFRDVGPAVDSLLQVMVFFTPVFYRPEDLGSAETLVRLNPYTYFMDFFRDPVLGNAPDLITVAGVVGFTIANLVLATIVFSRTRSRLPYWVA